MPKKPGYEESAGKDDGCDFAANAGLRASDPEASAAPDPWQPVLRKLPLSLAYAAVIDVRNTEFEITDQMVTQACQDIEVMQQFPFAPKNTVVSK